MSKTFTYTKETKSFYMANKDEFEYECVDFDYEVDDGDLLDAVCDLVNECYFEDKLNIKNFKKLIRDFDILDELVDGFEDELKEYFSNEAFDSLD